MSQLTQKRVAEQQPERAKDDVEKLSELHRKYRYMEGSSKSWSDVSQKIIKRQRAAIEKLKADNNALKHELALEETSAIPSQSLQQDLARMRESLEIFARKIEVEKRKIEDCDKQILACEVRMMETRKLSGGVNANRETGAQIEKQKKILENRLEKAIVRFNESVGQNKALRDEIDNLRRERVVFDQIYKKIEKELQDKKREMANVIELSNISYEARDQAQNEIAALRAQADREQAAYEQEIKELGKIIEADRRAKELAALKALRPVQEVDEESKQRKKGVAKGSWGTGTGKDRASIQVTVDKVQTYDEAFAKIQEATGIGNIDELVTAFINAEDQNFTLFNYVNDLNKEIEKLEEQVAELRAEAEKQAGFGATEDGRHAKAVAAVEEKLARTQAASQQYEQKVEHMAGVMQQLREIIQKTFQGTGCDTAATRELLGEEGVTETNIMQYLGIIEQRANELISFYNNRRTASRGSQGSQGLDGPRMSTSQAPPAASAIVIEPPSTTAEDFEDEEGAAEAADDDHPMTREELQAKTMRNLTKRMSNVPSKTGRRKK